MTSAVNGLSLPYLNEIFGHEEASNAVTKREQEAARRFGDERYGQHWLKNKVQTLQQSLTAEQLQKVIQETQRELNGNWSISSLCGYWPMSAIPRGWRHRPR